MFKYEMLQNGILVVNNIVCTKVQFLQEFHSCYSTGKVFFIFSETPNTRVLVIPEIKYPTREKF